MSLSWCSPVVCRERLGPAYPQCCSIKSCRNMIDDIILYTCVQDALGAITGDDSKRMEGQAQDKRGETKRAANQ